MANQDLMLAIKQKVVFSFIRVPADEDKLKLHISYLHSQTQPIYIHRGDFMARKADLSDLLEKFVKTRAKKDLYNLAYAGYGIFQIIDDALSRQDSRFYNVTWKKDILGNIKDTKKSLDRITKPNKILEVVFPADFSFYIGLLFPREPNHEEWDEATTNELLQLFFDFRFKIINKIEPTEFEGGIYLSGDPLKNGETIKAIHAKDSKLNISELEGNALIVDPNVKKHDVETLNELIEFWKNKEHPRFILFSTHYMEDEKHRFSFKLTYDQFTNTHLVRIGNIPHDQKAFFFLNGCKTGELPNRGFSNVLTQLYPKYSLGFITTAFDLYSLNAAAFPDRFNKIFMQENIMVLDAFVKTKNYLIFQAEKPQYTALGYMLWQVDPKLTYSKKPIKRMNGTNGQIK